MHSAGPPILPPVSICLVGILAVLPLRLACADADGERESLARLIHELQSIEPLLRAAESQAEPDARIRFRYDWLRQDLGQMRLGIQAHLNAPRTQPRSFPPLRGDYRQ